MKFPLTNHKDGEWRGWFAWHPVVTDEAEVVWLVRVQRRWNAVRNFRIINAYDPGQFDGEWQYKVAA